MSRWTFTEGLHHIGDGLHAYLQPDGGFGFSNAGLIADSGQTLLVDTLYDEKLTAKMLRVMRDAEPAAAAIGILANTHSNGDHTYGNGLMGPEARIIASHAAIEEMNQLNPATSARLLSELMQDPDVGAFVRRMAAPFDHSHINYRPADEGFSGELVLNVGDKPVHLIEVGPAHTRGDILVHVPGDRVVFTGDILFIGATPMLWSDSIEGWIAACDRILDMDVDVIVPGHGPITDKAGVRRAQAYLVYLSDEVRKRYDAGMSYADTVRDIDLSPFAELGEPERIVVNVAALYRSYGSSDYPRDPVALFRTMAQHAIAREQATCACAHHG